jgi:UDP-4-amino-4,6-dideoxy-N-acetyl-beta-L-altrosamine N-acetyltransferase
MSDSYKIRPVSFEDLVMLLEWRNHPDVRKFMFTQHEISLDEHISWFESASKDSSRFLLIIVEQDNPIGYVQFCKLSTEGAADWGFYVRPNAPKGSGRKICTIALNFAFGTLNLQKICGQAIESNVASARIHKSLGFTEEHVVQNQSQTEGVYHNLHRFSLCANSWFNIGLDRKNSNEKI